MVGAVPTQVAADGVQSPPCALLCSHGHCAGDRSSKTSEFPGIVLSGTIHRQPLVRKDNGRPSSSATTKKATMARSLDGCLGRA
jgi:hypothetical protein